MKRTIDKILQNMSSYYQIVDGGMIPRPMATELHGQKANKFVHMNFLFIGICDNNELL